MSSLEDRMNALGATGRLDISKMLSKDSGHKHGHSPDKVRQAQDDIDRRVSLG